MSKRRYTRSLCGPAGGWGRAYDTRCLGAFAPMLLVSYRPLAPVHVSRARISPAQPLERLLARASPAEQPHIFLATAHSTESNSQNQSCSLPSGKFSIRSSTCAVLIVRRPTTARTRARAHTPNTQLRSPCVGSARGARRRATHLCRAPRHDRPATYRYHAGLHKRRGTTAPAISKHSRRPVTTTTTSASPQLMTTKHERRTSHRRNMLTKLKSSSRTSDA